MEDYFEGAINQLVKRARLLLDMIPRGLPREFHTLEQSCSSQIHAHIAKLRELKEEPFWLYSSSQSERLREFRRIVHELDRLETIAIAALNRVDAQADLLLNELINDVREEIAYPLLPPVVAPFSQDYFRIYVGFNLLCVPLAESSFLLHLPDLYHELAHPLIAARNDPRVESFQKALVRFLRHVSQHIYEERRRLKQKGYPVEFEFYTDLWLKCWWESWAIEFFCDLFATYTAGPAYGWAHYHLTIKRGGDPFAVPSTHLTTHPADAARMQAILSALQKIGFKAEAQVIQNQWEELISTSGFAPPPEYWLCYPNKIIEFLAESSLSGTRDIGCHIAMPASDGFMFRLLNIAWIQFWKEPQAYSTWEQQTIDSLRSKVPANLLAQ